MLFNWESDNIVCWILDFFFVTLRKFQDTDTTLGQNMGICRFFFDLSLLKTIFTRLKIKTATLLTLNIAKQLEMPRPLVLSSKRLMLVVVLM